MKPKPATPEWSAYSAGQRAFRAGQLLKDNPITYRGVERMASKESLHDWWDVGWREAQRQDGQEQTP